MSFHPAYFRPRAQTGSGKTHSLGILTRVAGESGIIPRALSHIFGAIAQETRGRQYSVTASFAQIYLDAVQDLLVGPPPHLGGGGGGGGGQHGGGGTGEAGVNLAVREDPSRGFYVEGLSEYAVRSFEEATALLNWGLEHRILGATRMNSTSSRSHTILTVRVECKVPASGARLETSASPGDAVAGGAVAALTGHVTTRATLLICDLAGSERVRRTNSKGARLEEARAINGSLHTLGQVIAVRSGGGDRTYVMISALSPRPCLSTGPLCYFVSCGRGGRSGWGLGRSCCSVLPLPRPVARL